MRQISISLPDDLASKVAEKVEAGSYASIDDAILEGVRALVARDDTLEAWLRTEVVEGHAEYLADPSRAIPAEDVLERIKARRAEGTRPENDRRS